MRKTQPSFKSVENAQETLNRLKAFGTDVALIMYFVWHIFSK
jgi:hypothetical protein